MCRKLSKKPTRVLESSTTIWSLVSELFSDPQKQAAMSYRQDFPLLPQDPYLFTEPAKLLALFGDEAFAFSAVDLCMLDSVAQGQVGDA